MRETQILRGLHKARAANRFFTGMVPQQPMNTAPMSEQDRGAFNNLQDTPVAPAAASDAAVPDATKPRQLRGTTTSMLGSYQPIAVPELDLSRGTPYLHGPGTATSDSIPAHLSKGEAVLPAKTVAKVGVENIARLIEQTNDGIAPARGGLRAGGHFADARVPPMADVAADLLGQKRAPSPPPGSTAFNSMANDLGARGTGTGPAPTNVNDVTQNAERWSQSKRAANATRFGAQPPPLTTPTMPASPPGTPVTPAELPKPQGLAGRAGQYAGQAYDAMKGAFGAVGESKVASGALKLAGGLFSNPVTRMLMSAPAAVGIAGMAPGELAPGTLTQAHVAALKRGWEPAQKPIDVSSPTPAGTRPQAPPTPQQIQEAHQAATAERTGLKLASRQSLPTQQDPRLLNANTSRPELGQSRDFSNELNGAKRQLPADLREGVIYKTVDAQGRVTYSGRNVGANADMVDGMGKKLEQRGSVQVAAPGSVAMGPGGYAFTPVAATAEGRAAQHKEWNDKVAAMAARAEKEQAERTLREAAEGINQPMSRHKRAAMIEMQKAKMQQQTAAASNATAREQNEINREQNQLTAQGVMARINFEKQKYGHELQQTAADGVNDDAKLSPFATEVDPKTNERKVSDAAANDLRQFRAANAGRMTTPDGKPVDMARLRATNRAEYDRMNTAQDAAFGLGRLFNKYAKDTTFGAQTGWGMPKISGMREASISDWTKGMSLKDAALAPFKPGYYSQGVEIDLGGRKQIVPLGEILDDQNGGQLRDMLNEWRKANGLPMLGNAVTGE